LFGVDLSAPSLELGHAYEGIVKYYSYRSANAFTPPLSFPTAQNRAFKQARALLDKAMLETIRNRRQEKTSLDLLGMLMQARDIVFCQKPSRADKNTR
jgi:cytochrome P450